MSKSRALVQQHSEPALPAAIAELGEEGAQAFVEYFAARIRSPNTRAAYARAVKRFLEWIDDGGLSLRQVQPLHVASFIEALGAPKDEGGGGMSVSSVKQHLSALKQLGAFLLTRGVLVSDPFAGVRAPRHVVRVGKTPILEGSDARALLESIDPRSAAGARDRALLGAMVYTFARVSALLAMDRKDYFQVGRRMIFRLKEKGGRHHEMPAHHTLVGYMDVFLEARGQEDGPLFPSVDRQRTGFTENRLSRGNTWDMVKRRCGAAGLGTRFSNHSFRGTGITAYLENGGSLDYAQFMAGHASSQTTKLYDRRKQVGSLDEVERIIL